MKTTTPETHSSGNLTLACVRPLDDKGDAVECVCCDIFEGHIACDHSIDAAFAFCGWLDVFFDAADPHWIHYDWDAASGKFCRTRCQISYCCERPYRTRACLESILEAVKIQRERNRTNREAEWTRPERPLLQRITAERLAELRGIGNADDSGNDDDASGIGPVAVDINGAGALNIVNYPRKPELNDDAIRGWIEGWVTGYCRSSDKTGTVLVEALESGLMHALNYGGGPQDIMARRRRPRDEYWIAQVSECDRKRASGLAVSARAVSWPATTTDNDNKETSS